MNQKLEIILEKANISYVNAYVAGNTLVVNLNSHNDALTINELFLASGFDSKVFDNRKDVDPSADYMVGAKLQKGT